MSYLTTPLGTLKAQVITALEGEGFPYDPLHVSWGQYLATALGEPSAYLSKSHAQMLSEIDAQYGGTLSHLRASIAQLLDDVAANIGAGGGGGDLPVLPDGFAFVVNGDSYVVDDSGDFIITEQ
jgi:hypothetical protein